MSNKNIKFKYLKTYNAKRKHVINNSRSLWLEIKRIIYESALNSTSHGIPNLLRSDRLSMKIIWAASLTFFFAICAWLIIQTFNDFFSYEVVTKTTLNYDKTTEFPTITVCNINQFMTSYALDFINGILKNNVTNVIGNKEHKIGNGVYETRFMLLNYFAGTNAKNPNITDDQRKRMGISFDKMLISCLYNFNKCSPTDFEWYYDIFYGNCFRFNSGKASNGSFSRLKAATRPGKLNGLIMELYVGQPAHINSFGTSSGAHIFVNNKTVKPLMYEGIDVPTGVHTNIAINRFLSKQIPHPYSSCLSNLKDFNSTFVRLIMESNYTYRQKDCFDLCYQRFIMENCGCYDLNIANLNLSYFPCLSSEQLLCTLKYYEIFFLMIFKIRAPKNVHWNVRVFLIFWVHLLLVIRMMLMLSIF